MLDELCGNDSQKWEDVKVYAIKAMEIRIQLWDGILNKINEFQVHQPEFHG
jgi:hypothetical protein